MSDNKFKYFKVTRTLVVRANNQSDAIAIANGKRGVTGKLMTEATDIMRVPAAEVHSTLNS